MRKLIVLTIVLFLLKTLQSQQIIDSVSMNSNYTNQVFYSLENGVVSSINNENWTIALSVSNTGAEGSSIILNEANSQLWAYPGSNAQWTTFDTSNHLSWEQLLNTDTTWTNGAFNKYRGAAGAFDMGWGILNPNNNFWIFGDSLYLIKLSDNSYKKLWVVSLKTGLWEFKYADIDGANEHVVIFNKSSYPNRNFIYYDMLSHQLIDREPANNSWDLTFLKHSDFVNPPGVHVAVTSIFSNKKVWSAKSYEIDYNAASTSTIPQTSFIKKIDNIGREWKKFTSGSGWRVYDSIAYFLYNSDSTGLYRLVFTGFGGTSNGTTYFTKELIQAIGIEEQRIEKDLLIFPNPAKNELTVYIRNITNSKSSIQIADITGKIVLEVADNIFNNQLHLDISSLKSGIYIVSIQTDNMVVSSKFSKQ